MDKSMTTDAASSGAQLDRREVKQLMRRNDRHGLIYFGGWLLICAVLALAIYLALGSWLVVPALLAYAFALSVGAYSMSHECAHGTPFKTRWLNEWVYWIAALVYTEEPIYRRYTHADHHSYTWITGLDTQMNPYLPMTFWGYLKELFGLYLFWENFKVLLRGALGRPEITDYHGQPKDTIPEIEYAKIKWNSRAYLAIYGGLALWALVGQTWWPVIFFFLPRLVGQVFLQFSAIPQHAEMASDETDLRLTTRTWRTHPIMHFVQWNMAYHLEHHLYPTVPFHALPKLHEKVRPMTPEPAPGAFATHYQILRAIFRRLREDRAAGQLAA